MLANLVNNIAFLIALVAVAQMVMSHGYRSALQRQLMLGLSFGGVALLGMANPLVFLPGVIFDGRTAVLAVAGVVGGGVTAAISAGMAAFYRYQIGGSGAAVGMSVAVLSALLGVLARRWWQRRQHAPRWYEYGALGVVVQLMQLTAFTQIPDGAGFAFIQQAWWVLLSVYPLATMLLCLMFRNFEQQRMDKAALESARDARVQQERASLQRFHAYFDQSIVGLAITGPDKSWIEVNDALCASLGYTPDELLRMTWAQVTHPDDLEPDTYQFERLLAGEIDRYVMEKRFVHKRGHVVYARLAVGCVRKADGEVDYVLKMIEDISERKAAEAALRNEKEFSDETLHALPGVFYMFDAAGRFVHWNHQFGQTTGYDDAALATMRFRDFFTEDDAPKVDDFVARVLQEGKGDLEAHFLTRDGRALPYLFTSQRSAIGDDTYLLGVGLDIGERQRTEHALALERAHLHALVNAMPDLIWFKDMDGKYISCNAEFERFFGAKAQDILGRTDYDFVSKSAADEFRRHDMAAVEANAPTRNEEWISYASDGRRVLLETTKVPIRMANGHLVGVLGVGHDITERQAHQLQLERIAHFDTLTGLPNRVLLADRLQQAMAQVARRTTRLAVVYLDLDGFKAINDHHGHDVGDQLLRALASEMKHALREGDTLARLGGDEFVAIFLDLPGLDASMPLLRRLQAAVDRVTEVDGIAVTVSASMGVTYFPQSQPIDADQLLRQADQAMYQAKQMGKNRYHIFDADHDLSVRSHHEELQRLEQALHQHELVLYYQPKVNMRTGEVIGAEALIRWQHPERGLLPPASFLPLLADAPLAVDIGHWVLDTVMAQIEVWKAAGLRLQVSANVDAIHLEQPDFIERLRALQVAHPAVGPGDLELEILETSALDDTVRVSNLMLACREMGVGFALDDFGTGYSSLTYLKQLPADLLKIDQSFVRNMLDQPDDLAILEGIMGLSKAFRRRVVAEGVETQMHGEMLLRLGFELAQGYAVARPMPASEFVQWASTWRTHPAWQSVRPLAGDDLLVLSAWVEHRAWIEQVVGFVRGEAMAPPPLNPEECRVGRWMHAHASVVAHQGAALEGLNVLHQEIHHFASELVLLKRHGQNDEALARVHGLYQLRDHFLALLMGVLP